MRGTLIERDATVCQLKSEIINAKQQLDKQTNQDVQEITKKLANAQDKIELLQSKIQQFEMLVAGYTEEDDALLTQLISIDGTTSLKVAKYIQQAFEKLTKRLQLISVNYSQAHEQLQIKVQDAEARMNFVEVEKSSLEKIAHDRLERIEQMRMDADEKDVRMTMREAEFHQTITNLHQEIACHLDCIEQLKKEKRELIQSHESNEVLEAMGSYEEVLKQEFHTMRQAFELKAKQAAERLESQEKKHFQQLQDTMRKYRDERMAAEVQLNKFKCEINVLREKCIFLEANRRPPYAIESKG
ncbi:unnamed protein product [Aphanomyces euteiches]